MKTGDRNTIKRAKTNGCVVLYVEGVERWLMYVWEVTGMAERKDCKNNKEIKLNLYHI